MAARSPEDCLSQAFYSALGSCPKKGFGYPQWGTLFLSISDDFVTETHQQVKEKRILDFHPNFLLLLLILLTPTGDNEERNR